MAILGIDLGTTNSLIAVLESSEPRLIKNSLSSVLTPSACSIAEDGSVLVGAAASERLITHPERTVASFKRFMGAPQTTKLGNTFFRPEELSALVLRSLKADAEADLGETVTEAIISVPAYFNDHQRKATIDAGRLAGLSVQRLVNEPTAAALAYGFGEVNEGKFLIFDLGGGTFDVSILEKYDDVMEIRATTGDTQLGGNDFTRVIEELISQSVKVERRTLQAHDRARLNREAEVAKLGLTTEASISYACSLQGKMVEGTITRVEFETACAPLLRRLRTPTERAILDAGLDAKQFDAVVLVGGATRMPMVRSFVARLFGRLPLVNLDPDTIVARGAAIQAGLHKRAAALKDVVMTDVSPYTLGVAVREELQKDAHTLYVLPVIERNAVVPISRTKWLTTIADGQKIIALNVYQGENLRPENNIHLGLLEVPVPQGPAGQESIEVRFTYDISGSLQVEAKVLSTGKTDSKIFGNALGLTEEELNKKFAALENIKLHPREQLPNKALLARAERLYSEHRGEARESIRLMMVKFDAEISDQNLRNADAVREGFSRALDSFERSPFSAN